MHLAGHDDHERYLIDAHGSLVVEPVWELYAEASRLFPDVPACIEWDRDIPTLDILLGEMKKASDIAEGVQARGDGAASHAS